MKYGSDKEVQAVTFNIKEDRVLEKTMQTLRLEEDYAMKLLDLGSREVKINNRRLKNRVSRIKSHLTAADILDLRGMELEGRLKPMYTGVTVNATTRIAAAARRLGLSEATPRTRCTGGDHNHTHTHVHTPPVIRAVSAIALCAQEKPPTQTNLPSCEFADEPAGSSPQRPSTSHVRRTESVSHPPRARTSMGYSSHDASSNRERSPSARRAATPVLKRRMSMASTSSIGSNYAKTMLEDRRQGLLDAQHNHNEHLKQKQEAFLIQVQKWVEENPPFSKFSEQTVDTAGGNVNGRGSINHGRVIFRNPARDRENDLEAVWKDLNKCRYLRVSEELVDLSGVVTLAKDQMKLFDTLKRQKTTRLS